MIKKITYLILLPVVVLFSSCSNNEVTTPGTPVSFTFAGEWTVDQAQMVNAPSGSSSSSIMKQGLVPFGLINASTAGYMDIKFGAENLGLINTNLGSTYLYRIGFKGNFGAAYDWNHLYVTPDGGSSWNTVNLPFSIDHIYNFSLFDESTIYLMYTSSNYDLCMAVSFNRGNAWQVISTGLGFSSYSSNSEQESFCFVNSMTGYAVPYNKFYKTTNGGQNWEGGQEWSNLSQLGIKFFDANTGLVAMQNSNTCVFIKTTDGGVTFNEYQVPNGSSNYTMHFYFLNSNTGWASLKNNLYKTVNGALSWTEVSSNYKISRFAFKNDNEGFASCSDVLLKTSNGGVNWFAFSTPNIDWVTNIAMVNSDACVMTESGEFLRLSGVNDTTKWTAHGKLTNSAIKLITKAPEEEVFTNGEFTLSGNSIIFTVNNFSEDEEHDRVGTGTYEFNNNILSINLNLPDNEKWLIKLKRK